MCYLKRQADLWWNQLLGVTKGGWERAAEGACQMVSGEGSWDGAVRTAQDEPSHIPGHIGPPEAILQQQEGAVGPWVASAQRSVSGMNQVSALCSGNIL